MKNKTANTWPFARYSSLLIALSAILVVGIPANSMAQDQPALEENVVTAT